MVETEGLVWEASQREAGFNLDLSSGTPQSSRQDEANTRRWRSAVRSQSPGLSGLVQVMPIQVCPPHGLWGPKTKRIPREPPSLIRMGLKVAKPAGGATPTPSPHKCGGAPGCPTFQGLAAPWGRVIPSRGYSVP